MGLEVMERQVKSYSQPTYFAGRSVLSAGSQGMPVGVWCWNKGMGRGKEILNGSLV